ncbi:MAG: hypothetical protein KAH38_03900 [Candidatus Hydrogenedentes bacterium]|nr:hypothetical protein [Candidatus Hydrogenedentota bacterium]
MGMVTAILLIGMTLTMPAFSENQEVLFEDNFEKHLGSEWTWLRENKEDWRITDRGLEICARPGDAVSVKNALLLTVPEANGSVVIFEVTITYSTDLTQQFEQAGITWYTNGIPVFKLVHERIDGDYYIIPGRVPAENNSVRLRLEVQDKTYIAKFRNQGEKEYRIVAEGDLAAGKKNQISLQTYHGPGEEDHWMCFSDFKIMKQISVF